MRPGPLPPPSASIQQAPLPIIEINQAWYRSHLIGEPPTRRSTKHAGPRWRFDDPDGVYTVLYVASDPEGAFVETFGQLMAAPQDLPRSITSHILASRALTEMHPGQALRLVDITGAGLARIGADSRLFAGDHEHARPWSKALHDHPAGVDGILYPTRHDPTRKAAAVFNGTELRWSTLSQTRWLDMGIQLRDILNQYGFALIESKLTSDPPRKRPQQERFPGW